MLANWLHELELLPDLENMVAEPLSAWPILYTR